MKKYSFVFLLILMFNSILLSQSQFELFIAHVNSLPDSISKSASIDSFLNYARTQGIPFIESNTANYFLRGPYNTAEITGDFNEFSPYLDLTRLSGTDFFYYSAVYELNARLDYEFRVNGSVIINDPENPDSILGYYGYHSELAMPDYIQPWEIEFNSSIPHGSVISSSIFSDIAGRTYQLKIYLPSDYSSTTSNYPTVYFQDGSSYTDWGSAINVLDNLISANKIQPVIAVFVIPNDRAQEYAFGFRNLYRQFFVNELVPFIDSGYRTINLASKRLVMGDSYGGNISALISYNHPDVFGNCALQSAALHPNNYEVYNMLLDGEVKNIKFSSVWGSYDNRNGYLTELKDSLISKGYETDWQVLPEGHSWGLWRATVDTILQYFFPLSQPSIIQTTVNTIPSGRNFEVDGISYSSQQTFSWVSGSTHTLSTASLQNGSTGVRYIWDNWSDGGTITHTISSSRDTNFTANFSTEYYLTMFSDPGGSVAPASDWILAGTPLQIEATPNLGYSFSGWTGTGSGSYSGQTNPVTLTVQGPITQTASFIVTPINAPSNLSGQILQNPLSVELFWQDNSGNEVGFIIERENVTGDAYIIVDSVSQNVTAYLDTNLNYLTYNYRVKAFNSLTESTYSDTLQLQIPVELINFSAVFSSNKVELAWVTATETNNIGFEVERKVDSQLWQNIGFVPGSGTTTEPQSYNFTDQSLKSYSSIISYRLKQIDSNGSYQYSQIVNVDIKSLITDYKLFQNYPNPFNPTTKISFQIPKASEVKISVYNLLGEEIKTLINEFKEVGFYEIDFEASSIPSGIYFYKFSTEEYSSIRKMILLK